jgi:hypothetical protein
MYHEGVLGTRDFPPCSPPPRSSTPTFSAYLDRYDAAVARAGDRNGTAEAYEKKLAVIRRALAIVAEQKPSQERTVALLELFATV